MKTEETEENRSIFMNIISFQRWRNLWIFLEIHGRFSRVLLGRVRGRGRKNTQHQALAISLLVVSITEIALLRLFGSFL